MYRKKMVKSDFLNKKEFKGGEQSIFFQLFRIRLFFENWPQWNQTNIERKQG